MADLAPPATSSSAPGRLPSAGEIRSVGEKLAGTGRGPEQRAQSEAQVVHAPSSSESCASRRPFVKSGLAVRRTVRIRDGESPDRALRLGGPDWEALARTIALSRVRPATPVAARSS